MAGGCCAESTHETADERPRTAGAAPPGSAAQRGGKFGGHGTGHAPAPGGCTAKSLFATSSAESPPKMSWRVNSRSSPKSSARTCSSGKEAATERFAALGGNADERCADDEPARKGAAAAAAAAAA